MPSYAPPPPAPSTAVDLADLRFPPMPHTLSEITAIMAEVTPNTQRLVEAVQTDAAITASVLRRVNSAYYAVSRQIARVDKAVLMLGFYDVCELVLDTAIKQAFQAPDSGDERVVYEHLMKTSVATALYAKRLSKHLGLLLPETAFTAGLLHTLGRLVMLYNAPRPYAALWVRLAPAPDHLRAPSAEAEQLVFDTNHLRLGAVVGKEWALPEEITTVIEHQEDPAQVEQPHLRQLVGTVAVASAAAERLFSGADEPLDLEHLLAVLETCQANEEGVVSFLEEQAEDVRAYAEALLHG